MSALEPLEAASAPAGASRVSAMSYAESVQEELEQIQDGTSWADIMNNEPILIGECDDVPSTIAATNFDLTDGGIGSPCNAPSVNEVPLSPPFQAMVRNLPLEGTDLESLFYLFGGGDLIQEIRLNPSPKPGATTQWAVLTFYKRESLIKAIDMHGVSFQDKQIKVVVMRSSKDDKSSREDSFPYHQQHGSDSYANRNYGRQSSYSDNRNRGGNYGGRRSGSQFGSQSSLYSHGEQRESNDVRYSRVSTERVGPSYGTLPNIRRGGGSSSSNFERQNSRRSGQRGSGYDRDRNDNRDRGGYSGRQSGGYYNSSGGGSLQKSDSYSHRNWDSPQPAPIRYILVFHSSSSSLSSFLNISPFSRSQTTDANHTPFGRSHRDSVESNRRFDSRASSRMSINEVNEPGAPVIRKASSNPFGDAKPVDTTAKLKEIDEKLEKQRKESREQRDKSPAGSVAETKQERETPPAQTQGKTMTFVQSGRGRGRGGGGHEHRGTGHHHGGHNMHVTAIAKRPTTEPIKEKSGEQPSPSAAKSPTATSSASRTETSSSDRTLTQTSAREADSSTEKATESPSHKPPPHHSNSTRGGQSGRGRGGRADYKHRGGGGGKQQLMGSKSAG
ncbi:hypothetical protein WR25_10042 isoform B [Diploscapter pachys]|uniref:RRM domain-containing protein n=1 Tax=Diploscapter pachys TaxID=2018661 RepID=A0A2A2JA76_9BILA|nr:hypothetical protein WR25_10042 isoform B [Diploscapter pachys]